MQNIKNIIFDLGGVVIDIEKQKAVEQLEKIGISQASDLLGEYAQKGAFLLLEKGEITTAELYDTLLTLCKPGTTCTDIRDAFEAFLTGLPEERLDMISKLREKGYKVFVLSNTNPLMYNHWIDEAFRSQGKTINDYFDGIVVSWQEKVCKPDPEIFRNLLQRYKLNPAETLMLDDSEANCNGARSTGMTAIRIMPHGEDSFLNVCKRLLEEKS